MVTYSLYKCLIYDISVSHYSPSSGNGAIYNSALVFKRNNGHIEKDMIRVNMLPDINMTSGVWAKYVHN